MHTYAYLSVCMSVYASRSGVERGQREHKGSFRGYPKIHMFLVEDRGSFRGYPLNYPP